MAASIETSGSTLKVSYQRFISDAAPGLLLILAVIVAHGNGVRAFALEGASKELKTLVAVVALLLAVPVGLVVNGTSHLLLGAAQTWVNRWCFGFRGWPIRDTHRSLQTDEWSRCFGVQKGQWPVVGNTVDKLLKIYVPRVAEAHDHVRALKKFLRSLALLALAGFVVRVATKLPNTTTALARDPVAWILLAGACAAIVLAGFISFHQEASSMLRAYILCGFPPEGTTISMTELRRLLIDRADECDFPP